MAPKGKPPAKGGKEDAKGKAGKEDAKGKEDKKDEPKKPIYMDPKARKSIMTAALVTVLVALVIFLLYRVQRNRAIQLSGAVDSLRGILAYRNETYEALSDKEVMLEIPKFLAYAKEIENRSLYAMTEVAKTVNDLNKGSVTVDQHIFHFSTEKKNFDEANEECKKTGALLAYFENESEGTYISKVGATRSNDYWFGLQKAQGVEGPYKWITGKELETSHQAWVDKEPKTQERRCAKQSCNNTNVLYECWHAVDCSETRQWICKAPPNPVMMSKDDGLLY